MNIKAIPAHESSFDKSGLDAHGKEFVFTNEIVTIKSTGEKLTIIDCVRSNKDASFYYKEVTAKKKIILHFTMGYLKGDIATLTSNKVSVPFVIGRNGKVYNLFASKYWSYHLGPGAIGGNTAMSKESIGIELSNIGPLKLIGDNLVTTYSDNDIYCHISETGHYIKLPKKYRGYEYYATFTNKQYESLILLLKFLLEKNKIPKYFLSEANRFNTIADAAFIAFSGIASHVNCRKDKTDIGPAFDWNRVISEIS